MAAAGILKLQRAGFTEQQVEALAEYFDEQMATKADLAAAEARLEATIEQVRGEIKAVEARLETKIEQARSDTIKWVVGVGFAQVATIIAVLKLIPAAHP
jgi:predicted nuclease with TOPRIM domain